MDTTDTAEKSPNLEEGQSVAVWRGARFQRLIAIAIGTGLLLAIVAAFNLKSGVDNLTQKKIPEVQGRLTKLQVR